MTVLTKLQRTEAIEKAVTAAMVKRKAAMVAAREVFAEQVYAELFGKTQDLVKLFPAEFSPSHYVRHVSGLQIAVDHLSGHTYRHSESYNLLPPYFELKQVRPVPLMDAVELAKDSELYRHLRALHAKHVRNVEFEASLREKLALVLAACKTYEQVRKTWPDGVKFLPPEPGKNYAIVTVGVIEDLDKILAAEGV